MKRFLISLKHAIDGIYELIKTEKNAQIHFSITILVILLGILFKIEKIEWMFLIFCIGLVFAAEALNTAIESVLDLVHPNQAPLAKKAKDIAAGGVLITAICSALIGLMIFLPKILKLI